LRSQRITTEDPDLAPIFGSLEGARRAAAVAHLARAEENLLGLRAALAGRTGTTWRTGGVQLDTYPSGQASISGYVENGEVSFSVELRPSTFFDESGWQPGDPPKEQATDAWCVDGAVSVVGDAPVDTGLQAAVELGERRYAGAEDSAAALAELSAELRELALSRPPDVSAWLNPGGRRTGP
jgi:hypothetical protein